MTLGNREGACLPRTRHATAVLLTLAVAIIYWQVAGHDFINYDDQAYVTDNAMVKAGLTWKGLSWAFSTFTLSNWHPLTWLSHMLDVQLFGLNPAGHHLMNVLFHLINTMLLVTLLWRCTGNWWRSLFVASLFGLHPLHVESVAWVAERKDVLSTSFWLLTMIAYSRYATGRSRTAYLLALLFFALGLLSKPMLVTVPFVLLLWDAWPLRRLMPADGKGEPLSRLLLEKVPFILLTTASCIVTYYAQHQGGATAAGGAVPFAFRAINALISYWRYLAGTVWPSGLAVIYPLPEQQSLWQGFLAGTGLLAVSAIFLKLRRNHPFLPVGWFWFLGTLVPVIGLVQVGQQAMADRYSYVPLIGLFIMLAWGIPELAERWRLPAPLTGTAAGLVLAALSAGTWLQLVHWKDSVTLFTHAVKSVPDNYIAYRILGNALSRQGRFDQATAALQKALSIRHSDTQSYVELAILSARQGRVGEALQHYAAALRIDPESPEAHYNLGSLLAEQGRFGEAIGHYLEVLKSRPGWRDVHGNLGAAYAGAGDLSAALHHYDLALRFDPDNADLLFNRGMVLSMSGRLEEGIASLRGALARRPASAEIHYTLGVALAKSGRMGEASQHFADALRLNPALEEAKQALETTRGRTAR